MVDVVEEEEKEEQDGFPSDRDRAEEPAKAPPETPPEEPPKTEISPMYCPVHEEVIPITNKAGRLICPECSAFVTKEKTPPKGVGEGKPSEEKPPETPVDEMLQEMRKVLEEELNDMTGASKSGIKTLLKRFDRQPNLGFDLNQLHELLVRRFPKAQPQDRFDIMGRISLIRNQYVFDQATVSHYMAWGQQARPQAPMYPGAAQPPPPTYPNWGGQQVETVRATRGWEGQQFQGQSVPLRAPTTYIEPKKYKLVVDGETIETDESGFRAWSQYRKEQALMDEQINAAREERDRRNKAWELEMEELKKKLAQPATVQVPGEKEGETHEIPVAALPFVNLGGGRTGALEVRLAEMTEDLHKKDLEMRDSRIADLDHRVDTLSRMSSSEAIDKKAKEMGYTKFESPIYSIAREGQQDFHEVVKTILPRIFPPKSSGGARYTDRERKEKTGDVLGKLTKARELAEAEAEILSLE